MPNISQTSCLQAHHVLFRSLCAVIAWQQKPCDGLVHHEQWRRFALKLGSYLWSRSNLILWNGILCWHVELFLLKYGAKKGLEATSFTPCRFGESCIRFIRFAVLRDLSSVCAEHYINPVELRYPVKGKKRLHRWVAHRTIAVILAVKYSGNLL